MEFLAQNCILEHVILGILFQLATWSARCCQYLQWWRRSVCHYVGKVVNISAVRYFPEQYPVNKAVGWRKNIWRSCNLDYVLQNISLSRQTRVWWLASPRFPLVKDGNLRRIPSKVTRQCSSTSQGLIIYTFVPRPTSETANPWVLLKLTWLKTRGVYLFRKPNFQLSHILA